MVEVMPSVSESPRTTTAPCESLLWTSTAVTYRQNGLCCVYAAPASSSVRSPRAT